MDASITGDPSDRVRGDQHRQHRLPSAPVGRDQQPVGRVAHSGPGANPASFSLPSRRQGAGA